MFTWLNRTKHGASLPPTLTCPGLAEASFCAAKCCTLCVVVRVHAPEMEAVAPLSIVHFWFAGPKLVAGPPRSPPSPFKPAVECSGVRYVMTHLLVLMQGPWSPRCCGRFLRRQAHRGSTPWCSCTWVLALRAASATCPYRAAPQQAP